MLRGIFVGAVALWAVSFSNAQVVVMNHIDPVGQMSSMPNFGILQIFPDFPVFSSTVIDDFTSLSGSITRIGVAFEVSNPNVIFSNILGWRVSVWPDVASAGLSGNGLDLFTEATALIPSAAVTITRVTTQTNNTYRADMPAGLNVSAGRKYIGVTPILPFDPNGQLFILRHPNPSFLGAGTANNANGVNPGNGFGQGTVIPLVDNAAILVEMNSGSGGFLETVRPYDYNVLLGRRASGDTQSLKNIDLDSLQLCKFVVPNTTVAPVIIEIVGRSRYALSNLLTIRTQTRATTHGEVLQSSEVFDYTTGKYDPAVNHVQLGDTWLYKSFDAPSPAYRFFSSNKDLMIRMSFKPIGPVSAINFCVEIDSLHWDLSN